MGRGLPETTARAWVALAGVVTVLLVGSAAPTSELLVLSLALVAAACAGLATYGLAVRLPAPAVVVVRRGDAPTTRRGRATDPQHHPLAPRAPGLD